MDHNGDNVIERSMFVNFVVMVCRRKRIIFFFYFVFFFKIIFFVFSKDLIACSFDHSCKEQTQMEIEE